MNIKRTVLALTSTVFLSVLSALPALAGAGYIVGDQPGSRVNVRTEPNVYADSYSYGIVGDRVEIIDWMEGYDGWGWYYVEFPGSGTRGYIRADFIEDNSVRGAAEDSTMYR